MARTTAVLPVLAWPVLAALGAAEPQDPRRPVAPPLHLERGDRVMLERGAVLRDTPPHARAWVGGRESEAIDLSAATLAVPADSTLIVATGEATEREERPDGRHFRLPFKLHSVDASGAVLDAGQPDVFPVRSGLLWNGTAFTVTVRIGLLAQGAPRQLASPVTFLLGTTADSLSRTQIDLVKTNTYELIELFDRGAHPTVELTVMPLGLPDDVLKPSITLPLERPKLALSVNPRRLQGFGLQTAEVTALPEAGAWPAESGTSLIFGADHGSLDPGDVSPKPGDVARSRLRSSGVGSDVVRVGGTPFEQAEHAVTYAFPTTFVAAALLGGVAGAIAAVRVRQKRSIRRRDLGTAAVTALVAAVAYACGVNLVGIDLGRGFHEALVFTVGAVSALVGLPALKAKPSG